MVDIQPRWRSGEAKTRGSEARKGVQSVSTIILSITSAVRRLKDFQDSRNASSDLKHCGQVSEKSRRELATSRLGVRGTRMTRPRGWEESPKFPCSMRQTQRYRYSLTAEHIGDVSFWRSLYKTIPLLKRVQSVKTCFYLHIGCSGRRSDLQ